MHAVRTAQPSIHVVTFAAMTDFALTLNIELGVLRQGGEAPRQLERNLTELIRKGVFREVHA